MPRSRSRSIESSTCSRIWRGSTVCVSSRMRSASVDLPWSMWAMIEKLRMRRWFMECRTRLEVVDDLRETLEEARRPGALALGQLLVEAAAPLVDLRAARVHHARALAGESDVDHAAVARARRAGD